MLKLKEEDGDAGLKEVKTAESAWRGIQNHVGSWNFRASTLDISFSSFIAFLCCDYSEVNIVAISFEI